MRVSPHEAWEHPFGRNEYFLGALISGIFARKDAKKAAKAAAEAAKIPMVTTTDHVVDLLGMNKSAMEAGYNPMTILNAGGLSAFTKTTNTTTGHNAMAAAQAQGAVPSMGSVFSNAFAGTIDSLAGSVFKAVLPEAPMSKNYFPPAPSSGMGMAEAMGWNTLAKTPGGSTMGTQGANYATGSGKVPKGLGLPLTAQGGEKTVTNPYQVAWVDPTVADGETFETRYADLGSNAAVPYIAYQDYVTNMTGLNTTQRAIDPKGPMGTWFMEDRQLAKDAAEMIRHSDVARIIKQGLTWSQDWMAKNRANAPLTAAQRISGAYGK